MVTPIEQAYIDLHPKSAEYYATSKDLFPNGVTHDARNLKPFPYFVTHAQGSRKWDVDGNEIVDYKGGHGALILGHNHPDIVTAVTEQMTKGHPLRGFDGAGDPVGAAGAGADPVLGEGAVPQLGDRGDDDGGADGAGVHGQDEAGEVP